MATPPSGSRAGERMATPPSGSRAHSPAPAPTLTRADHLDRASVKALHMRFGEALRWYVPLGLAAWFHAEGVANVVELDWWEEAQHAAPDGSSVRLVLTPAQHATMRGFWGPNAGRRQTLWGGWAVLGARRCVAGGGGPACRMARRPTGMAHLAVGPEYRL